MIVKNDTYLRFRLNIKKSLVLFWLMLVMAGTGTAQEACMLIPTPLQQRVEQASLILEGKVTARKSFWDAARQNIYTANTIEVYKLFKGRLTDPTQLEIITEGGTVGDRMHIFSATLALQPGQQGIFFLEASRFATANQVLPGRPLYSVYSSLQGFIQYRLPHNQATEPFRTYQNIQTELYPALLAFPQLKMETIRENPDLKKNFTSPAPIPTRAGRTLVAPTIAGFAPDTITAGTGAILTITGQDFGDTRGEGFVEFENANDGGASFIRPLATDYIAWSDNTIRLRVPSVPAGGGGVAGTGKLRVMNNSDTRVTTSGNELTIRYAVSNVEKEGKAYQPYHIDANGNGGYIIQFAANVPGAGRNAFQRSMQTWTCYTNINWVADATTSSASTTAEDKINLVRLAGPADLPANVLGRTVSRYEGCQIRNIYSYLVSEFDFEFNDRANWQFGPAGPAGNQYDFETTTLHELGHAHQLAHIIQPRSVMHYSIGRTQLTRALSGRNDVEGGNQVTGRSFQNNICAPTRMAPLVATNCNLPGNLLTFQATLQPDGTALINWTSQNESGLSAYIVQKSTNGIQWSTFTSQTAGGSNGRSYSVSDPRPNTGFTFYRLRLVNLDNNYSYSPIRQVGSEDNLTAGMQLFPNPVLNNSLHFEYQTLTSGKILIKIYDYLGREHAILVRNVTKGNNPFYLGLDYLTNGFYILQVIQDQEVQQVKFLKQ